MLKLLSYTLTALLMLSCSKAHALTGNRIFDRQFTQALGVVNASGFTNSKLKNAINDIKSRIDTGSVNFRFVRYIAAVPVSLSVNTNSGHVITSVDFIVNTYDQRISLVAELMKEYAELRAEEIRSDILINGRDSGDSVTSYMYSGFNNANSGHDSLYTKLFLTKYNFFIEYHGHQLRNLALNYRLNASSGSTQSIFAKNEIFNDIISGHQGTDINIDHNILFYLSVIYDQAIRNDNDITLRTFIEVSQTDKYPSTLYNLFDLINN